MGGRGAITIGISVFSEDTDSTRAIADGIRAKGAKVLLFTDHAKRNPAADCEAIQALILMGNNFDIDPAKYIHRYPEGDKRRIIHPSTKNEMDTPYTKARAEYEEEMIRLAIAAKLPLLGICGGMQRINVHLGGTLHQHLPDMVGDDRHCQRTRGIDVRQPTLPIIIEGGTMLAQIGARIPMPFATSHCPTQPKVLMDNSIHHQAVDIVAPGMRICCLADGPRGKDGRTNYLIKGIEPEPGGPYAQQFLLGVQWHPEFGASAIGSHLIDHLLEAAEDFTALPRSAIDGA